MEQAVREVALQRLQAAMHEKGNVMKLTLSNGKVITLDPGAVFKDPRAEGIEWLQEFIKNKEAAAEPCGLCGEKPKADNDWVCPECREHLSGLSLRTKRANRPGGGSGHGWLRTRRMKAGY